MAGSRLFLSAVSSEFGAARDALRHDFGTRRMDVATQEELSHLTGARTLLELLDNHIARLHRGGLRDRQPQRGRLPDVGGSRALCRAAAAGHATRVLHAMGVSAGREARQDAGRLPASPGSLDAGRPRHRAGRTGRRRAAGGIRAPYRGARRAVDPVLRPARAVPRGDAPALGNAAPPPTSRWCCPTPASAACSSAAPRS